MVRCAWRRSEDAEYDGGVKSVVVWASSALLLVASLASAAPQSDADKLYREGVKLLQEGDMQGAADHFRKAIEIKRSAPSLFNLGQVEAKLGHLADAKSLLEEAKQVAEKEGPKSMVRLSAKALSALEQRLPHVIVALPDDAGDAHVELDGKPIPTGGEGTAVMPGSHKVVVTARGYEQFESEFSVAEGERHPVAVVLQKKSVAAPQPPPEADRGSSHKTPIGPIVLGGVGLVALGGATYFYFKVKSIDNERHQLWQDSGCPGPTCPNGEPPHAADLRQDAESKARLGNIFLGVGAVAVVGAGVWYFLSKGHGSKERAGATLHLTPTPGGVLLSGSM
jgi:tetratricopeptide (TPR) repeat protein